MVVAEGGCLRCRGDLERRAIPVGSDGNLTVDSSALTWPYDGEFDPSKLMVFNFKICTKANCDNIRGYTRNLVCNGNIRPLSWYKSLDFYSREIGF